MDLSPAVSAWASRFFAGRNCLDWHALVSETDTDGWAAEVLPWLALIERDDPNLPLVLPCVSSDGSVSWYGAARSVRGASQLGEELQAFIGPSYSDFAGRPHEVDDSDAVEAALREHFVLPLYRFRPARSQDVQTIRRAIMLYRGALERRPPSTRFAARPLGAIRTQFDFALLAGDEPEARRLLEEILATGRLSTDNRVYLEVRLLAGLGLWHQIVGDIRLLRSLADLPLPARVLTDVVEALYQVYAEPFEAAADAAGALRRFQEAGIERLGRIFATRRGVQRPRVVKAFLLYELLRKEPGWPYFQSMIELLNAEATPFVDSLAALFPRRDIGRDTSQTPANKLPEADEIFENNGYDRALELYTAMPPSPRTLGRMIACARAIGSHDAARKVLEILNSQPADLLPKTEFLTSAIAQLRATAVGAETVAQATQFSGAADAGIREQPLLDDWLNWARWVKGGASVVEAEAVLHQRAATWSVEDLANDPAKVSEIANVLGNAIGTATDLVKAAFPYLFQAFISDAEHPVLAYKPLYSTLVTLIALSEQSSQDNLELARQLTENLLAVGITVRDYDALILDLGDLLDRQRSYANLSWALDVTEVLSIYPSANKEGRLRFFMTVLEIARAFAHRLDTAQFEALKLLCKDFGISVPSELETHDNLNIEADDKYTKLAGKHVAIYTLTKPAATRAATILSHLCPTAKISINSDPVCSEQLTSLARSADIFVFAWKSSKHQAFYCVKNHRPKNLPLLQPLGKGSASILRALLEE
jgi:hypothetical protein